MKAINQAIRKEIDASYKMKEINKDKDISKETSMRIFKEIQEKDKKIKFYQKLSKAIKEVENEKNN